jgi:hypothetical protein
MPYQDGTGPSGDGRPGKGFGPCGRFGTPVRGGFGKGMNRGRGMGFRQRRCWWDFFGFTRTKENQDIYPYTREDMVAQKEELEKQVKWLNEQLENKKD